MRRTFGSAWVLSGLLAFSQGVWASGDLEMDMKRLAKSTMAFAEAKDAVQAKKQLLIMRKATVASKKSRPHKLERLPAEHEQVKSYQQGLDLLITEIDKLIVLVDQGKLEQAQSQGMSLVKIRNEYHKKFR